MFGRRCLGDAAGLYDKAKAFADAGNDEMAVKVSPRACNTRSVGCSSIRTLKSSWVTPSLGRLNAAFLQLWSRLVDKALDKREPRAGSARALLLSPDPPLLPGTLHLAGLTGCRLRQRNTFHIPSHAERIARAGNNGRS